MDSRNQLAAAHKLESRFNLKLVELYSIELKISIFIYLIIIFIIMFRLFRFSVMGLGADEEMMYSPLQVVSVVCLLVGIFQVIWYFDILKLRLIYYNKIAPVPKNSYVSAKDMTLLVFRTLLQVY